MSIYDEFHKIWNTARLVLLGGGTLPFRLYGHTIGTPAQVPITGDFDNNGGLFSTQFGFVKGKSTVDALLHKCILQKI